ncbi:MAG: prephenate dehydratase [Euryarchaeota archaeon]|nr:prephenate dehydratase [Euryarchaeota archaeon]
MALVYAYQGEPGAYSEMAAIRHFKAEPLWRKMTSDAHYEGLPCATFARVVSAVVDGSARVGLLPVENTLEGNIDEATDLLPELDLHVVGEVEVHVRHCLLAPRGTKLDEITHVHSHPQGLRQCRTFLESHPNVHKVAEYDTAGAARSVSEQAEPGHAAIASRLAADHYDLDILAEGIESGPDNYTRFIVVSHDDLHPTPDLSRLPPNGPGYKTSLVFSTRHEPGALYNALGAFAANDVNLTKLESRPRRRPGRRWSYHFFADCDGHAAEPDVAAALGQLVGKLSFLKVLGSYPRAVDTEAEEAEAEMEPQ